MLQDKMTNALEEMRGECRIKRLADATNPLLVKRKNLASNQ